jgi:hypothetical protein
MILFLVLFGGFLLWGIFEKVMNPSVFEMRPMTDEERKRFERAWFLNRTYQPSSILDFGVERLPPDELP